MPETTKEKDIKTQVNSYVLLMILQRIDDKYPDFIRDILEGAKSDYAASKEQINAPPAVSLVFEETIKFLEQANSKNNP